MGSICQRRAAPLIALLLLVRVQEWVRARWAVPLFALPVVLLPILQTEAAQPRARWRLTWTGQDLTPRTRP